MIIGLTGLTGTGKNLAQELIFDFFDFILDVDKIGNLVFRSNEGKIFSLFGVKTKKEVSALVFSNREEMEKLESITTPGIRRIVTPMLKQLGGTGEKKRLLVNCALLFEFEFDRFCDHIIILDSSRELRVERLTGQRGIDAEEAERRISYQEKYSLIPPYLKKAEEISADRGPAGENSGIIPIEQSISVVYNNRDRESLQSSLTGIVLEKAIVPGDRRAGRK